MSGIFKSVGRWFGQTVAGGIVEGFAFVAAVSIGLSLWSWLKGATFEQAALLGLFAIVLLALALYLVSLAVFKFHERQPSTEQDRLSITTNAQVCPVTWLHEIAKDEAETIYRFVLITECHFGKHELLRSDHPYIEFFLYIENRSVYDVTLADLTGSISFDQRELVEPLRWLGRPPLVLTHGNIGSFTFRQSLTQDDAVHILSGEAEDLRFDFSRLEVKVLGYEDFGRMVVPQFLHVDQLRPAHAVLLAAYPKLNIEIAKAVFSWIVDTRIERDGRDPSYLVTMEISITNLRPSTIAIDTFELMVMIHGQPYVALAGSGQHLWPRKFLHESGREEVLEGKELDNLNASPPLIVPERNPIKGALQFRFGAIQLNGAPPDYATSVVLAADRQYFKLTLIAKTGEKHFQAGNLST